MSQAGSRQEESRMCPDGISLKLATPERAGLHPERWQSALQLIESWCTAGAVPAEVENKVIYTVLSKPVRRFQYLLGKFVGVQMTVLLNLALMGGLFFIALYIRQGIPPTLLLWAILMTYFEFLIISAFTFAVAATASSAVLPTIAGLFIYITGNLTEYLSDVAVRSADATAFAEDRKSTRLNSSHRT